MMQQPEAGRRRAQCDGGLVNADKKCPYPTRIVIRECRYCLAVN